MLEGGRAVVFEEDLRLVRRRGVERDREREIELVVQKAEEVGRPEIGDAVSLAALAALTHGMRLGINEWFNHNDIAHLGMAAAVYFYYLGAKNLTLYDQK